MSRILKWLYTLFGKNGSNNTEVNKRNVKEISSVTRINMMRIKDELKQIVDTYGQQRG